MDLTEQIDIYCERMDPGLFAEPWNLVSNAAFLIAAAIMAYRLRGSNLPLAWGLVLLLTAIGIGSGLWHSFATTWAALSDVIPIVLFILLYVFAASRDVVGWSTALSLGATFGALLFIAVFAAGFAQLPFFRISASYWPIPLLLTGYAFALRNRTPQVARGFLIATGLLCLSLTLRSIDDGVCEAIHRGTHFLWHLLNGLLLGYLIEVYRRHVLATREAEG